MKKLILIFLAFTSFFLKAQDDSTKTSGAVQDGHIMIEKKLKIVLNNEEKPILETALKSFHSEPIFISFDVEKPVIEWPPYTTEVPYKNETEGYPKKKYINYAKVGFGNYTSPLAEVGLFYHHKDHMILGSHLFYESFASGPVLGENSSNSDASFDIVGKYKKDSLSIKPSFLFGSRRYNFYGIADKLDYPIDPIKSVLNDYQLGVSAKYQTKKWHYYFNPLFSAANQMLKGGGLINKESTFGADARVAYNIDSALVVNMDVQTWFGSYKSGTNYNRSLVSITPTVAFHKKMDFTVGANLTINKNAEEKSLLEIFPVLTAKWVFHPDWYFFGFVNGGIQQNALQELLNENQFLDDSLNLKMTQVTNSFGGELNGNPLDGLRLKAGLKLRNMKNFYVFSPSESDSSRFVLLYDKGAVLELTFNTSVLFTPNNRATYGLGLDLVSYETSSLERAWNLPTFTFNLFAEQQIGERVVLGLTFLTFSGIHAPVGEKDISLKPTCDLDIDLSYNVTSRIGAFMQIDNLFGNEYVRYQGYPNRGLAFKFGAKVKF